MNNKQLRASIHCRLLTLHYFMRCLLMQLKNLLQYELDPEAKEIDVKSYNADNLRHNVYETLQKAWEAKDDFLRDPLEGLVKIDPIPSSATKLEAELWLLPGSRHVIKLESMFNYASQTDSPSSAFLLAFRALITKMQQQKKLDLVIVDCSPSSGILNKVSKNNL